MIDCWPELANREQRENSQWAGLVFLSTRAGVRSWNWVEVKSSSVQLSFIVHLNTINTIKYKQQPALTYAKINKDDVVPVLPACPHERPD